MLAGIWGVMLWPMLYAGWLHFYPGDAHTRLMIEGFMGAFVLGIHRHGVSAADGKQVVVWRGVFRAAAIVVSHGGESRDGAGASGRRGLQRDVADLVHRDGGPVDLRQSGHAATRIRAGLCGDSGSGRGGGISGEGCESHAGAVAVCAVVVVSGVSVAAADGDRAVSVAAVFRNGQQPFVRRLAESAKRMVAGGDPGDRRRVVSGRGFRCWRWREMRWRDNCCGRVVILVWFATQTPVLRRVKLSTTPGNAVRWALGGIGGGLCVRGGLAVCQARIAAFVFCLGAWIGHPGGRCACHSRPCGPPRSVGRENRLVALGDRLVASRGDDPDELGFPARRAGFPPHLRRLDVGHRRGHLARRAGQIPLPQRRLAQNRGQLPAAREPVRSARPAGARSRPRRCSCRGP